MSLLRGHQHLGRADPRHGQPTTSSRDKVGHYFKKLECFCFKEQTYEPGKTVKLPVVFFVSPDMAKDWQARTT